MSPGNWFHVLGPNVLFFCTVCNWFHILGPNVLFLLHRILFAPYVLFLYRMYYGV